MNRLCSILFLFCLLPAAAAAPAAANLHDTLPARTAVYLRLSGADLLEAFALQNPLYAALAEDSVVDLNNRGVGALAGRLEQDAELRAEAPWLPLLTRLGAPVEALVLLEDGQPPESARLLLSAGLEVSIDELNGVLQGLSGALEPLEVVEPVSSTGRGMMMWERAVPVVVEYDQDAGRVYATAGRGVDRADLAEIRASSAAGGDHPMYALEARIDSTARGPLLWLDVPRIVAAMGERIPPAQAAMLQGIRGLGLGLGMREGKGRLALLVDAPRDRSLAGMLPVVRNDFSFAARGEPGFLVGLSVPTRQLLQLVEGLLQGNPQAHADFLQQKQLVSEALGLPVDLLVGILGPELVFFTDRAGEFLAVRLAQPDLFDKLLQHLAAREAIDYQARQVGGATYHHLAVSVPAGAAESEATPPERGLPAVLSALSEPSKYHFYWQREGDYLILAKVPQALSDRHLGPEPVNIGTWLAEVQKQHTRNAFLLLSTRLDSIPRRIYYAYLEGLQQLLDLTDVEGDILELPGAAELGLPRSGSYGLQLGISDPYLGLELSFEATPVDFLADPNGLMLLAVGGVLAAVAIPAYNDYTIRAQVARGLSEAAEVKQRVAEVYLATGDPPRDRQAAGLAPEPESSAGEVLLGIDVVNGTVVLMFGNTADEVLQGEYLGLSPYRSSSGAVVWRCGRAPIPAAAAALPPSAATGHAVEHIAASIADKYLPADCREQRAPIP